MVKYQKKNLYHWKKSMVDEDEEAGLDPFALIYGNSVWSSKRAKPKRFYIICISLASCSFILATLFLSLSPNFYSDKDGLGSGKGFLCSSVPNGTICCDRRSRRSDVCVMKGDVRTLPTSSSIILYPTIRPIDTLSSQSDGDDDEAIRREKIRPYTRKWEDNVMDSINELDLIVKKDSNAHHRCDVHHDVPAVFFSTGGYTGNLYHEFNDGILPLYITAQHFNRKVVFVILEYHSWWITKYGDILSQLSDYQPIDFSGDKRVHCFPEAIVGLRIHDELSIDPFLMEGNQTRTIVDFHDLLDRAYWPRISGLIEDEEREREAQPSLAMATDNQDVDKPKLVIISRNGSRSITNEASMVRIAERIGFKVELLRPEKTTELAKTYRALNSSDVMVGVHGAAMTHFLFMKPGSVFIQVVPLGLDWAAETYYGEPAIRLGLRYIGYKILPKESSLYEDYNEDDPILMDPNSVNRKGWEFTKKIYLDRQNVKLDLRRFGKRLLRAYYYTKARRNGRLCRSLQ